MAQKTIKVTKVEILKKGNTNGYDWVRRKVYCEGDDEMKEFTTLDDKYANSEGQQMQDNFSYNEQYKNWQVISVKKAEELGKHDEIMNGIRKCWDKIDDVEKLILDKNENNK